MSKIVSCPGCSQPLQMAGVTAAQVRCPHCLRVLTLRKARPVQDLAAQPAPAPPAPAVEEVRSPAAPAVAPSSLVGRAPGLDFRQWSPALRLLPAGLLVLILGTFMIRDRFVRDDAPEEDEEEAVVEVPLDPDPLIRIKFQEPGTMRFGLTMCKESDRDGNPKRLTFADDGNTNNAVVQMDGDMRLFGKFVVYRGGTGGKDDRGGTRDTGAEPTLLRGRWSRLPTTLGEDRSGRQRIGTQGTYSYDSHKIEIVQSVEIVPGQVGAGQTRRHLDTCLVRYRIKNRDAWSHRVGFRFVLDTFIGANDGVPFTLPSASGLCDTCKDFNSSEAVPDFIQALERPSLDDPGTVAHLTLRLGGEVEAPSRVTLGHWTDQLRFPGGQEPSIEWHFPVEPLERDSCVVLYWDTREMQAGEQRELGFAYGLGHVSSKEGGGKLGLTVGGSFRPGEEFTVTAYVHDPVADQTVSLELPRGLERVDGAATQAVPPLPAGSRSGNSPVTWKVKAARTGRFNLRVKSNNGLKQSQAVTVTSKGIFD